MKKPIGNLASVVRRARESLGVDMQKTRSKLLTDLKKMFDVAQGYATHETTKDKQRQIWIRIMAYIAQVMNSLGKSFDETVVTQDLEKLERMILEAVAKEKDSGANGAGPSAAGS